MSHQPERPEKNCLNCGTEVQGRFCQACGQENIVPHQNFWSLTLHFIYDIFHFDGKFFDTLGRLLFKPGRVPREYVSGRRMSYLDPIRMYLFTSAIFFLVFFTLTKNDTLVSEDGGTLVNRSERLNVIMHQSNEARKHPEDTVLRKALEVLTDSNLRVVMKPVGEGDNRKPVVNKVNAPENEDEFDFDADSDADTTGILIHYKGAPYRLQWRSVLIDSAKLKEGGWLERAVKSKAMDVNKKYGDDVNEGVNQVGSAFLHRLPYLLFLSLPFFALILKLLYVRRKQFFYSDHAVFTLYHYIFSFILMLIIFLVIGLKQVGVPRQVVDWLLLPLTLAWPVHLYIAMRRFYHQGWLRTLGKFLLHNTLGLFILGILFTIFAIVSFLT